MAHVPRKSPFGDGKSSSSLVFEEFVPPSGWTEDSTCHYLLVDLPGFKREELKLQVDNQTHIVVSGERQVRDNKYKRFEQSFKLPKNADVPKITGKLEGEILYISVPKKVEQEHGEIKHAGVHDTEMKMLDSAPPPATAAAAAAPASDADADADEEENGDKSDAYRNEDDNNNKRGEKDLERRKLGRGSDEDGIKEAELFLRLAIEKLRKNKGIVVTAIFAFSLGVLVTQKFQSGQ